MPVSKLSPAKRPLFYSGRTYGYRTGCGKVFVTVNVDDTGYPVEAFITVGKAGGCSAAFIESVARTLSIALRCGVDATELAKQYIGIQCPNGAWDNGQRVTSCASAIGMAMKHTLDNLGARVEGPGVDEKANGSAQEPSGELSEADVAVRVEAQRVEREKLEG